MKVRELRLEDIKLRENSRIDFKDDELHELMTSMKQSGLLQPVGVVEEDEGGFELSWGFRRFSAAKKLGWKTIECHIQEKSEAAGEVLIKNAIENMLRANVSLPEQGRIFWLLQDRDKLALSEIAARVGVPLSKIKAAITAFQLVPPEFRKSIGSSGGAVGKQKRKGKISPTAALKLITLGKNAGLSRDALRPLYEYAKQDNVSAAKLAIIARLMARGVTLEEARSKSESLKVINVIVAMDKKRVKRLEKKYGKKIGAILELSLVRNREFGIERSGFRATGPQSHRTKKEFIEDVPF